jgi:hypothetical protein
MRNSSGKLLIAAMLLAALAAAAASWWFRYSATHRTVEFWGPEAAVLLRDAPHVALRSYDQGTNTDVTSAKSTSHDISNARGLVHLRTALLEDSSYDWSAKTAVDSDWKSSLVFEVTAGAEPRLVILFSPDFNWAANGSSDAMPQPVVCCKPISDGLKTFFNEILTDSSSGH